MCGVCWAKLYHLRAVTMVVASPLDMNWAELYAELRKLWMSSTQMANWCMTRLRAADPAIRTGSDGKMVAFKQPYLYPEARALWTEHPPQSITSLLQTAQSKYSKSRLDVVWRFAAALPTFRYPVPYPLHNQAWSASLDTFGGQDGDAQCPVVSLRLGGRRVRLRLRGGPEFSRQLGQFRQIVDGKAVQGELAIYPVTRRGPANRGSGEDSKRTKLLVKMVAWLPTAAPRARDGVATLSSDEHALLVLTTPHGQWTLHADLAARWQAEHRRALQHLADDTKYEQRRPERRRRMMARGRDHMVEKHHNRIDSFLHQAAAWTAAKCDRARVARLTLDLTPRGRFESFPWHRLSILLAEKLGVLGIASTEVVPVTTSPLESETQQ